jgi:hypothetical protein
LEAVVRVSPWSILVGAAAALTAAGMTPAVAGDNQVHVLTVQLPGGGVEHIQYSGDVAPRIVLVPMSSTMSVMQDDPFAALERISDMMQQQEIMMLRQMQALTAVPFGAGGHAFVSTMAGNGVCMRSVRITYNNGEEAPKVVSSTSGDCGRGHGVQTPVEVDRPAPMRHKLPNTIEVKATGHTPDGAPARQVAWNR